MRKKQVTSDEKKYWLSADGLARIRYHRAILGDSEESIATDLMGVSYATLQAWKKGNLGLLGALKSTKKSETASANYTPWHSTKQGRSKRNAKF